MNDVITNFKNKLKAGHSVIGPFSKSCDPAFVEVCGHSGFDFVILDTEHGPNNTFTLQNLIRGAETSRIVPIVRVSGVSEEISKALDVGAMGVQVPQVSNATEAREAIKFAKFAPEGERGVCRFVRAADYSSKNKFDYFREANETLVILQMEGLEAIENIESILEVEGIDIIFIGPYDLSQSIGLAGQVEHPLVEEKMKEIVEKCKNQGIVVGTFCDTVENARKWMSAGVQYISYSVDVGIFYEACANRLAKIKE